MKVEWLLKMNAKKWTLLAYVFLTMSLAITLWGLSLCEPKYIFYGFILTLFHIVCVNLIFQHRESEESLWKYMIVIENECKKMDFISVCLFNDELSYNIVGIKSLGT